MGVAAQSELVRVKDAGSVADPTKQPTPAELKDAYQRYTPVNGWDNINTRFYAGGRFIGGALQLGAEVSLSSQGNIPTTGTGTDATRALPAVLAFSTTLGLDF